MINKTFLILCIFLLLLSSHSMSENGNIIPLEISIYSGYLSIKNTGKCPIYKLKITTFPPNSTFWQKISENASFKAEIKELERNNTTTVSFDMFLNKEGRKLDTSYEVDVWQVKGSYCGEDTEGDFRLQKISSSTGEQTTQSSLLVEKSLKTIEPSQRTFLYQKFISQIHTENGHLYWSNLKLGTSLQITEKSIGKPITLKKNVSLVDDSTLFLSRVSHNQMNIILWFESSKSNAKLLSVAIGFDGEMISEIQVKNLEIYLVEHIPGIKKYFRHDYSESSAWKLRGYENMTMVVKTDGVSIGFDSMYD